MAWMLTIFSKFSLENTYTYIDMHTTYALLLMLNEYLRRNERARRSEIQLDKIDLF